MTLSTVLTDYNSAAGLNCQEASGLTVTTPITSVRRGRRVVE
jgi:hypothetical protein